MGTITLLIADGQRLFSECLAEALAEHPDVRVLAEFPTTADETSDGVDRLEPDVVLLDYWIPGAIPDGAGLIRSLASRSPSPRLLALSWIHNPQQVEAALTAGAAGFIPKGVSIDHLVEAVRQAASGAAAVFARELERLLEEMAGRADEATDRAKRLQRLTGREVQILELLSHGHAGPDVASELCIAPKTLRTAVHRILRKLGVETQLQAIAMARHERLLASPGPQGTSVEADPRRRHFWTP